MTRVWIKKSDWRQDLGKIYSNLSNLLDLSCEKLEVHTACLIYLGTCVFVWTACVLGGTLCERGTRYKGIVL